MLSQKDNLSGTSINFKPICSSETIGTVKFLKEFSTTVDGSTLKTASQRRYSASKGVEGSPNGDYNDALVDAPKMVPRGDTWKVDLGTKDQNDERHLGRCSLLGDVACVSNGKFAGDSGGLGKL